jgi:hypothetical protein
MGTQNNRTPPWFVFLTTIALILGGYYLLLGVRDYVRTGGLGVVEATEQAVVQSTATAVRRATDAIPSPTLIPTFTPIPECQDWLVSVPSAIVRGAPNTAGPIVDVFDENALVCVIRNLPETDWYLIDARPDTSRIDAGYMRGDIIRPANPTPTPTLSPTPLPTVTPITPTPSFTPSTTPTPDPNATPTATATMPPTVTSPPTATVTPPPVDSI